MSILRLHKDSLQISYSRTVYFVSICLLGVHHIKGLLVLAILNNWLGNSKKIPCGMSSKILCKQNFLTLKSQSCRLLAVAAVVAGPSGGQGGHQGLLWGT